MKLIKRILLVCLAAMLFCVTNIVFAAETNTVDGPIADQRVAKLLREANVKYLTDQDGDYLVTYSFVTNRTQQVWINSTTSKYGTLEVREIWATAYVSDRPLSAEVANALLKRSSAIIIGGWSIVKPRNSWAVVFRIKVDAANQKASSLASMVELAAVTANGVNEELTASSGSNLWSP